MAFLGREQTDQLARRGTRQFLQQRRAIVRRHLIQNGHDLLVRHRAQQFLLFLNPEVFKNIRCQIVRQHPKDDHLFIFRHIEDYLGDIGRREFVENFAERREVTGVDQAPDFGF